MRDKAGVLGANQFVDPVSKGCDQDGFQFSLEWCAGTQI